jgi:hypothetical protein|tara:strand:- start:1780 stop:2121 length:342 start_codon:yes stop_codon:yes gene_type:complete
MSKETGIYYASGADEAHVAKVSAARAEADAFNQKALEKLRAWDTEMEHADVDESTGKMFKVKKPCMFKSSLTVYVDGKLAKSAMAAGTILSVSTKKPKKAKAPKADPVKASKK